MTVDEKYYIKVLLELTPPGPQILVGLAGPVEWVFLRGGCGHMEQGR